MIVVRRLEGSLYILDNLALERNTTGNRLVGELEIAYDVVGLCVCKLGFCTRC